MIYGFYFIAEWLSYSYTYGIFIVLWKKKKKNRDKNKKKTNKIFMLYNIMLIENYYNVGYILYFVQLFDRTQ